MTVRHQLFLNQKDTKLAHFWNMQLINWLYNYDILLINLPYVA